MSTADTLDSCLRVVANRCRNLKKAIERGKTWERASKEGQQLNEEQTRSVQSITVKEALLTELQAILEKQTALVKQQLASEDSTANQVSKRQAKPTAKAKTKDLKNEGDRTPSVKSGDSSQEGTDQAINSSTAQPAAENSASVPHSASQTASSEELGQYPQRDVQDQLPNTESLARERNAESAEKSMTNAPEQTSGPTPGTDAEELRRQMVAMRVQQAEHLHRDRREAVRMVLNLFHVVDFLHQKGSREAVLAFFQSPRGQRSPQKVDGLDMDLLCYFNVMLTSPNGNVPHNEAVDVSTAHCIEFLKGSASSAFKGTSYAKLREIALAIGSCPILTERGLQKEGRQTKGKKKRSARGAMSDSNGGEPNHITNDPNTMANLP